jgi:hypothetical protein
VWESDDSDTWGEITTHHGWWIRVPLSHGGPWCWVPGDEETPARVVWRDGDGFVGWAPEPPDWLSMADDDVEYEDGLDWVFTLLGTLLQERTDQNTLSGEAEKQARSATAPARSRDVSFARRQVGPTGASIREARSALSDYVARHPDVIAAVSKTMTGGASQAYSSKDSKDSKKSSGSSSSKKKDDASFTVGFMPMPYAMTYYDALLVQPSVAPRGLVPQVGSAGAGYGAASSLGSSPAAAMLGSRRGVHAHGAAAALPSSAIGGAAHAVAAHAAAPASSSTYSYSSSHSSSGSSRSSSHSSSSRSHSSHHR